MPPAGGAAGVNKAGAPGRAAAVSWARPGGGTWRSGRVQLSESAGKLRGAAAARARGASMPGVGAVPLPPPLQPHGRRGAGVPGAPRRAASIAAPRALIGLGAATTRETSPAAPPRAWEGRREAAPPRAVQPRTEPGLQPPLPLLPWEAARLAVSLNRACRVGAGQEEARHGSPWSRGSPLLAESAEPGRGPFRPAARVEMVFQVFPRHPALGGRLHLVLISKVFQFWKPTCARGFRRACGLWH